MSLKSEYPKPADLALLEQSARNLLGWEIAIRVRETRSQAVMAISSIEFFPTQDDAWQKKINKRVINEQPTIEERKPMQIFTTSTMGNPLVSVVLQRGPDAETDPLAVFKRVMVATGKNRVEELPWKKVFTDVLGVPAKQIGQLLEAMNFAPALGHPTSPVQLHRLTRLVLPQEDLEPPTDSHDDLHSKLVLSPEGKVKLAAVLRGEWEERQS